MEPLIQIREAGEEDAEAVLRYLGALGAERLPTILRPVRTLSPTEQRGFLRRMRRAPDSLYLVAVRGAAVVGQLGFHPHTHPQRRHAGELALSVQRELRGRGLGQRLLRALFDWIEQGKQLSRAELEVLANNPRAVALYERMGFVHEGCRAGAVDVDGELVDVLLMARTWSRGAAAGM